MSEEVKCDEIVVGKVCKLFVDRETPLGYMMTDDYDEVFLHKHQSSRKLKLDELVPVFVYFDSKKRLSATMEEPIISIGKAGWVEVVEVSEKHGVFINIGIVKDMLIPKEDLPFDLSTWPKVGDKLFCRIKASKTSMIGKMVSRNDLENYIEPLIPIFENDIVKARVIREGKQGTSLLTNDGHHIFVYYKHRRKNYRLGEEVEVKISKAKSDQEYNGILIEKKEKMIKSDTSLILDFLKENNGEMPFSDKSDPTEIYNKFFMSKSAFKRALGSLMKQKLIEQKDGKTYLINNE